MAVNLYGNSRMREKYGGQYRGESSTQVIVVAGCINALVGGCTDRVVMSDTKEEVPQEEEFI